MKPTNSSGHREERDEPGTLETDAILVRALTPADADAVARIDQVASGRSRRELFRHAIEASQAAGGVALSLAAEVDGLLVGFVIASVAYGEFGVTEPSATIGAIGVHPDFRGRHVARALMRQVGLNLTALQIERVRTEVDWRRGDLLSFFHSNGFAPIPRLVLEADTLSLPRD
jgi:predicted N-acetyltransferase YhbS